MSPNQGRRKPTLGKGGKGGGAGRTGKLVATRRLGLLVFGAAFVVLFAIVAIAVGVGHPSVPSGDVATVESVPSDLGTISETDFQHALEQSAAQSGAKGTPKPGSKKYEELKEAALGGILDMIWIQGQGEEMGITASEKEVAEELEKVKKQEFKSEKEYKEFLTKSKFTQADVNERVKVKIISTKIQSQVTEGVGAPSKSEIENYYEAAKSTQFTQQATRDVRSILNKDKKKVEEAKAALLKDDSAKSWKAVAKKYSEDPVTKDKGGLQKGLPEGVLEEPLNAAIFETPEEQIEGPIQTKRGYTIFEVENSTPASVRPLKDVEAQIKSQLEQQAQQNVFGEFVSNFSTRWKQRTFCASDFKIERCANFGPAGRPSTTPAGCYEANPKGGLPEACPAPVFQLVPAQPGTVTPVEPRGKPLAQRPHPAGAGESTEETGAGGAFPLGTP